MNAIPHVFVHAKQSNWGVASEPSLLGLPFPLNIPSPASLARPKSRTLVVRSLLFSSQRLISLKKQKKQQEKKKSCSSSLLMRPAPGERDGGASAAGCDSVKATPRGSLCPINLERWGGGEPTPPVHQGAAGASCLLSLWGWRSQFLSISSLFVCVFFVLLHFVLNPSCVACSFLQNATWTTPARAWAVTPPLRTSAWPSSHCSGCPRGTTGTASWKYEQHRHTLTYKRTWFC